MRLFKQQFVGMAVKEFIKAREISCDRTLFLGYSDGLAALVKEECISMEAGLKTAARLLGSEECWTAGITTLCKLAEVGGKSFDTSVALVKEVQWKLGVLAKQDEFVYDIKYLNSVTGWDIAVAR